MTLFLFGMFSLSRPLGFILHFSCSKLYCCKIKAVLSSCSIHVPYPHPHRTWQHMDLRFSHTLPSVTTSGDAHMLCVLSHPDTCRSDCCSLSDPRRQQSWQPAILVRSAVIALSRQPSLLATFALLETHALVFWHCLDPCGPRALFRRSSLLSNPLVYLVVRWVKIFVGYSI